MPRTRKPSEYGALARYLLTEPDLAVVVDALTADLKRQLAAKQFAYHRGHVSTVQLAGALAEAIAEQALRDEPYEPYEG